MANIGRYGWGSSSRVSSGKRGMVRVGGSASWIIGDQGTTDPGVGERGAGRGWPSWQLPLPRAPHRGEILPHQLTGTPPRRSSPPLAHLENYPNYPLFQLHLYTSHLISLETDYCPQQAASPYQIAELRTLGGPPTVSPHPS